MWLMVKKYDKVIPQKALESYIAYKRSGGKRVNKKRQIFKSIFYVIRMVRRKYLSQNRKMKNKNEVVLEILNCNIYYIL